ncbi:MAG: SDR family NAD(P)-dependent oxidoreductase [Snodgrassella sp.]|uniref:SDR family NAD(P)-dependent oxidoreductase n=1 Tax=Snodgrassella TaxID=1193515 RepID=UPI001EF4379F|nr:MULTISPECIES: SDR family NAD(P)-dependent oxidoreductase [Snodgrassella]MCO6520395.1 SDR family NAD(P)-dependent oxidoreductase [Snodgrassella sp.]MCO6522566.1 SDR family NAD(P)-dependent oxidoreductase [Snodgrassella sp.]
MQNCVIITGHNRGLGRALAEYYLTQEIRVVGLSRHGWDNPPERLLQYVIDFADAEALATLVQSASWQNNLENKNEVILINNAGIVEPNALAGQQDYDAIIKAIAVNITAPLLLTNAVIAAATKADIRIAHISSGAGRHAIAGWSVYGATKAALDQHAAVVAAENHPRVRIASIAPGVVDTNMQQNIRSANAEKFPLVHNFINLKAKNQLQSAEDTAYQVATMIAAEDYGQQTQRDVRE